jgi:hypothetical protein
VHRFTVVGVARVTWTEERGDDTCVDQLLDVPKDVFRSVILIMPFGIVLGLKVLIADWHLPQNHRLVVVRNKRCMQVLLPPEKVRQFDVQSVPPAILFEDDFILARVPIERIVEQYFVRTGLA